MELKIIDKPGPSKHGFWCNGLCGYCLEPNRREDAIDKKAITQNGY